MLASLVPSIGMLGCRGDESIVVAVLDGRIDRSHPCFEGAHIVEPIGCADPIELNAPSVAHGTHVASILFGQSEGSILGIVPQCRGISIPIYNTHHASHCSQVDLARAILIAIEHGAHVINVSGGQLVRSADAHPLMSQALATCDDENVLVVAAAGNDGCDCLHIPAALGSVLAVGAMDMAGNPIGMSNWAKQYGSNGILAPGVDILGALPGGGVARRTGTSFATPIVAGFAALLLSYRKRLGLKTDPRAIKDIILESATKCALEEGLDCQRFLAGRLNVTRAIDLATESKREISMSSIVKEGDMINAETTQNIAVSAAASGAPIAPSDTSVQLPLSAYGIAPSCGCGGSKACDCGCKSAATATAGPQLVYALGTLGYDFGSEARRDSIQQFMTEGGDSLEAEDNDSVESDGSVSVEEDFLDYLDQSPEEAERVIWTLNLGTTPIYAIRPVGAYSYGGYEKLIQGLKLQLAKKSPLFAVPGVIAGSVRLMSGDVVPVIVPTIRGITAWNPDLIITNTVKKLKNPSEEDVDTLTREGPDSLKNFLYRIERQRNNLGITGADRALNYAATTAYRVVAVLQKVIPKKLELDEIGVSASAICRPGSECYDIDLRFFSPLDVRLPDQTFRFTVDVSDAMPVAIGEVATWTERPRDK